MVLQRQRMCISGRSRRRSKRKRGLKVKHEEVWKRGVKWHGEHQSCTQAAIPRQQSCFSQQNHSERGLETLSSSALSGERLVLQVVTQKEGGSCSLEFALSQGHISDATQKQGGESQKNQCCNGSSLDP